MQSRRFIAIMIAGMAALFVASAAQAVTVWWKTDTVADWEATVENWSQDWNAVPVVYQYPAAGDWARMGNGTSEITITTDVSTGTFWSNSGYNSVIMDGAAAPTVDLSGSLYLSTPEDATVPGWTMHDGVLKTNNLISAWNNSGNVFGWFVQKAGTVDINSNLDMAIKSSTQTSIYDLEGGDLTANNFYLGKGGNHQQTVFNQSGGMATVNNSVILGAKAGDGTNADAKAVVNLDGGELTISGATPFVFTQPGAPVYVDIDGGALNLLGTWDFSSLTGIVDSDFRSAGAAATTANLTFEAITIDSTDYTRITVPLDVDCDFDTDGDCDLDDLDQLTLAGDLGAGVAVPPADAKFDLNTDTTVNQSDLNIWLSAAASKNGHGSAYRRGDNDLDRDVDITDFNNLATNFDAGGSNSATNKFSLGDGDGDGDIDITDFNAVASGFAPGGYDGAAATVTADLDPGELILWVDVETGEVILEGNAAAISGLQIFSAANSLLATDFTADVLQFVISTNSSTYAEGAFVNTGVDGQISLGILYDVTVDATDLIFEYTMIGQPTVQGGVGYAIPEPAGLALLSMGGLLALRRRRAA